MWVRLTKRVSFANVTAVLALVVALGGTAYAVKGIPGKNGVFHACVAKRGGAVRIVKAGSRCRRVHPAERVVHWSQRGPVGATGPQGVAGAAGAPGATNVLARTKTLAPMPAGSFTNDYVLCNTGERAVSGGVVYDGNLGHEVVQQSFPVAANGVQSADGSTPSGWRLYIRNDDSVSFTPTIYAICVAP
jgi:hypothetical protein